MSPAEEKKTIAALPHSPLLVGGATAASAFSLMRKLGVTCILNVTSDLTEPHQSDLGSDIQWHRIPLHDLEDEDISEAIGDALSIIDRIAAAGGKVLVHCHEGRSRSVTMCLAYFITRERMPLADALSFIQVHRPEAQPNAGFLRQLMALERATLHTSSMGVKDLPKSKPKCLSCDICGQVVGLKTALATHMKLKHSSDAAIMSTPTPQGNRVHRETVSSCNGSGTCSTSTHVSKPAVGGSQPSIVEQELTVLLCRENPSKVANIPHLLEKWAGREWELLAEVTAKYAF